MSAISFELGQFITILIMAIALGMDAFSLGVGIGMRGIRLLDIMKISIIVGFFHIMMPLMGMFTGKYVSTILGDVALIAGGILLVLLGLHMVYSSIRGEHAQPFDHSTLLGLIIFSLSVSIDSFSVGVSLGLFSTDIILTVLLFGLFGGTLSILGLLLGRSISLSLGEYGEAIGGIILLVFGIKFLI
ncbi:manganese efflux pump MntP [Chengkuizengella axinellae]|uniref:Putative manganese efflux pump MntP n=1 Tax=Chengkuizengella axinellae TaxID=3064388 RepID=A0ABT9J5G9_9BACL|nr:manganese efflux pump [Chengkuizengella sp. 2205SS18-9]MDP5276813.1 manganese efflux pump [Chengkuizengella sp. 2205SS18-9]